MSKVEAGAWYKPELRGSPRELTLHTLLHYKHQSERDPEYKGLHVPGQTWVMGYAIPPFQRPPVWEDARKVRFVESAARGLHLGTWVYNDATHAPMERHGGRETFHRADRWLIDGQQRFIALDEFFSDRLPVFGALWSEVPLVDQRRFLNQNFTAQELRLTDEAELRRHYDNLNFGGVPHLESQRAVRPDEDEAPTGPAMR